MVIRSDPHGARGVVVLRPPLGNLSIAMLPRTTLAKPGIRPIVNFLMACSDIWAIHQAKCKEWQKGGF
jgi:hypothetical protein